MRKVMVFGTFDVLHQGHLFLFAEARKLGDFLIAVVARDATVLRVKGRETLHKEQERFKHVAAAPGVDLAVLGNVDDVYRVLEDHRPDILCLGYDQEAFTHTLADELKKRKLNATVVRLRPYRADEFKSTILKARNQNKPAEK